MWVGEASSVLWGSRACRIDISVVYIRGLRSLVLPTAHTAKMSLRDIEQEYVLFFCPASGRFVRRDSSNQIAVLDLF